MLEKNGYKHILVLLHMIFVFSLFYILNFNNLIYNNYECTNFTRFFQCINFQVILDPNPSTG
jgi:hypothetical protein